MLNNQKACDLLKLLNQTDVENPKSNRWPDDPTADLLKMDLLSSTATEACCPRSVPEHGTELRRTATASKVGDADPGGGDVARMVKECHKMP